MAGNWGSKRGRGELGVAMIAGAFSALWGLLAWAVGKLRGK